MVQLLIDAPCGQVSFDFVPMQILVKLIFLSKLLFLKKEQSTEMAEEKM